MANGLGYKVWTRERLTVADLQGYLQDQVVMQFASAAARDAALTSPADGQIVYLEDSDRFYYRESGTTWRPLGSQWLDQGTGDALPSGGAGLRNGDFLYSAKYECVLHYTTEGWRQATPAVVDSLGDYVNRLIARGVTSVHNGYLVFQTQTNRLFASHGGALSGASLGMLQVGGLSTANVGAGFANVTGWNYVTANTWVRSLGGGLGQVLVEATKATSALTVPATTGNITNSTIGTVPSGYVPEVVTPLSSTSTGRVATGYIASSGDVVLAAVATGSDIAVGETISLGGIYRLANALT